MVNSFIKFMKAWWGNVKLCIESSMAYKTAFFLLLISLFLADIMIPIVSIVIYSVSSGIPGWSLYEFILFQGTLILVVGIWHSFFASLLGYTLGEINEGSFDKTLLRPFNSLAFQTSRGFDEDGIAEIAAGLAIVGFAMHQLHLFGWMLLPYAGIILLAALFQYSMTVIASALAFVFVKTWRLFDLITLIERFARYPMDVYTMQMRFALTFIIPAGVASYYPATILLGKQSLSIIPWIALPVIAFFVFSLWLWSFAIRKYSSAGG